MGGFVVARALLLIEYTVAFVDTPWPMALTYLTSTGVGEGR